MKKIKLTEGSGEVSETWGQALWGFGKWLPKHETYYNHLKVHNTFQIQTKCTYLFHAYYS